MDEKFFKFLFFLAALVAGAMVIGFFLITIKISLAFVPEVEIMGISMTNKEINFISRK